MQADRTVARRQPRALQRKFLAEKGRAAELLESVQGHSTRPATVSDIAEVSSFDVFVTVDDPYTEALAGVKGWTTAILLKDGTALLKITSSDSLKAKDLGNLVKADKMEVNVWINKKTTAEGQEIAILHEFERHVFPFYDFFLKLSKARVMGHPKLGKEGAESSQKMLEALGEEITGGTYTATAQHKSPELAAREVIAMISVVCEGLKAKSKEEYADILTDTETKSYRLIAETRNDTVAQGIDLAAMQKVYQPVIKKLKYDSDLVSAVVEQFELE